MERKASKAESSTTKSTVEFSGSRSVTGSTSGQGFSSSISYADNASRRGSRVSKTAFSFMANRLIYRIIIQGVDVTPYNVVDPNYVTMEDNFSHAAFEVKPRQKSEMALRVSKSRMDRGVTDTGMQVYATTIDLDDIHIDHTLNTEEGYPPDDTELEIAPSAFYLPKLYPPMSYPPHIKITLKETETCFLFDLPCCSLDKGSAEANKVEEDNEYYQYITVGKGRNRKMINEETQTQSCVTQTRHTLAVRPQKKNAIAFASMWDMHDTYARIANTKEEEQPDEMVLYQTADPNYLRKKKKKVGSDSNNRSFEEIGKTHAFNDAVMLTERVLATLKFTDAQKVFRGLLKMDPLSLDLVYIYTMTPLWTLQCEDTANKPITGINFNPKNENILAVAYGKYTYAENHTGMVCIWCTKNPNEPERIYRFQYPLTSVAFSEKNPNWLACGFANGDVLILDILSYHVKTIAHSKRDTNPCFDSIWVTNWRSIDKHTEYVMTACQDGRINRFTNTKTHDFICAPMMRISTVEGKLKGLEIAKTCLKYDVPITRYPAALCMKWHPTIDSVYFVGTDEGCIHKCSVHYLNQHIDVYRAHAGPVYGMEFSPFMNNMMVSCGADGSIRMWLEGMDDVIMTLNCSAAVYGIAFCPINSTILISVSGNQLSVWDLRRKTHIPCAEYSFPGNTVLTYVKFSASGDNVFVGDTTGVIHTFHLVDTPIPPFYQRQMLDDAIKSALCTRPQLLKQLTKLEKFRSKHK